MMLRMITLLGIALLSTFTASFVNRYAPKPPPIPIQFRASVEKKNIEGHEVTVENGTLYYDSRNLRTRSDFIVGEVNTSKILLYNQVRIFFCNLMI